MDDKTFRKLFDGDIVSTNIPGAYGLSSSSSDSKVRRVVPILRSFPDHPRSRPQSRAHAKPQAIAADARGVWTSAQWAGVTQSGTWTTVRGNWIVPTVSKPTTPAGSDGIWWMYSWVGLGGTGTDDLLQVGVDQRVYADGSTSCYAWYEWLAADDPNNPPYVSYTRIENLTVNPGDQVYAYAGFRQHNGVNVAGTVQLDNNTAGVGVTIPLVAPPLATMRGSTIEWVVENPGGGAPTYALAKFTPVNFTGCYGGTPAGVAGTIGYPSEGDIWNLRDDNNVILTSVQVAAQGANDPNETVTYAL